MHNQRGFARSRLNKNRYWRYLRLAGTAFSIALLALLLGRQDWAALSAGLRSFPITSLIAALSLLAARHFAFAWRWSILLRAQEIDLGYWTVVKLQYAGLFASNFLPTMVGGDVARLAGVLSRTQNKVAGAASLLVDRTLGAFGMLIILPLSWPLVVETLGQAPLLGAAASGKSATFLRKGWSQLSSALRLWIGKPQALLRALFATWFGILCYVLAIRILAAGLDIPVGIADVAGATGLTYFISLIPFTINAYGLRELSIVIFYTQLGATPGQAAALALLARILLVAISLPGAFTLGAAIHAGESETLSE